MSTTQEDYFGNAIDSDASETYPKHHHHHHHHRHGKPRAYTPPDSESEIAHPEEAYPDKREYEKPRRRRHRHHEDLVTPHEPEKPDTDTSGEDTDDGGRRRRRRRRSHRHRHRERDPDDISTGVVESSGETDDDRSNRDSATSSHGRMRTRDRAKSMGESAITALGLEETYRRARSKSQGRKQSAYSDEGYDSNSDVDRRSRSRSKGHGTTAQAAVIAAVVEAFRARKEPGGVTGSNSLKRIVEAAVASGVVEKFLDRKGEGEGKGNRRIAESVLAGLAAQRGINGKRRRRKDEGDEKSSRVKDLATSGLIAAAGKKLLDYQRSRSQSRPRGRSDSESPERPGLDRRRSRSVGEALAALGLGGLAAERFGRSRRDSRGSKSSRKSSGDRDSSSSDSSLSDSDLSIDETTEKERIKRLRRKEIISVALAILATINLGHVGYEAREKRALRKEKLDSGRINEEESDKLRNKALLKDASAIGIAILTAAEAIKAFRKMQESHHTYREFSEKRPKIERHRRQKMIQEAIAEERSRSPSRSGYYSQPGYMGPPPGSRASAAGYPAYPTSGPIPTYTSSRDAYSTRDGREIPVRYNKY
ncbi:hypothetical protein TWF718_009095 [Orbilia javanica]|uniref:Uncharacterized protein n=1 Tax=Orbilia javanica TaxID=47235 RepID=A0AAN8N240_9PEZI